VSFAVSGFWTVIQIELYPNDFRFLPVFSTNLPMILRFAALDTRPRAHFGRFSPEDIPAVTFGQEPWTRLPPVLSLVFL